MKKMDGHWYDLGNIKGLEGDVRSIKENKVGDVWAANDVSFINFQINFDSLQHLTAPPADISVGIPATIQKYLGDEETSFDVSTILEVDNELIFNSFFGTFSFDSTVRDLVPATRFLANYPPSKEPLFFLHKDLERDLWIESFSENTKYIDWFHQDKTGKLQRTTAPFFRLNEIETVFDFYAEPKNPSQMWLAGDNGLARFDKSLDFDPKPAFAPLIRQVSSLDDSILFGGTWWQAGEDFRFPYKLNSLRFEYALPDFDAQASNLFQYKLEGFDEKWSKWSEEAEKEYTNLPEGTYEFKIRAQNIYQEVAESQAFQFAILAPWYRRWWAFALYFSSLVGAVWLLLRWRTQRLKEQNRALEKIVKERTDEVVKAREQMFMQEKMASLGQMTAGVAHEIKNPLNFVNNFAKGSRELAEDIAAEMKPFWDKIPEDDASYIQEMLQEIQKNATSIQNNGLRADSIINSMMNHVQHTSGKRMLIDLNKLVEENIDFSYFGFHAEELGFEVNILKKLDPSLPQVNIIPQEVGRVLINMLQNALYALLEKKEQFGASFQPELEVRTRSADEEVLISIKDNGPGIPADIKEKIFTPFFTTKPTGSGNTGLGLSISYDIIVQSHKGKMEVESEEGKYTIFNISLPKR